jgi:hypothetical protein
LTEKKENKRATQMKVVEDAGEIKTTNQTKEPLFRSEKEGGKKANRKTSKY